MSVDFEPTASEIPPAVADAPLPSFDIPEPEAPVAAALESEAPSRQTPRPMAALPQLSEVAEDDDDDAVTHIGLPVVPETPVDYPGVGAAAFSVAVGEAFAVPLTEPVDIANVRIAWTMASDISSSPVRFTLVITPFHSSAPSYAAFSAS